jgi:hypothetical protein
LYKDEEGHNKRTKKEAFKKSQREKQENDKAELLKQLREKKLEN